MCFVKMRLLQSTCVITSLPADLKCKIKNALQTACYISCIYQFDRALLGWGSKAANAATSAGLPISACAPDSNIMGGITRKSLFVFQFPLSSVGFHFLPGRLSAYRILNVTCAQVGNAVSDVSQHLHNRCACAFAWPVRSWLNTIKIPPGVSKQS